MFSESIHLAGQCQHPQAALEELAKPSAILKTDNPERQTLAPSASARRYIPSPGFHEFAASFQEVASCVCLLSRRSHPMR